MLFASAVPHDKALKDGDLKGRFKMHTAMVNGGFHLPPFKAPLITLRWLHEVRLGLIYVPTVWTYKLPYQPFPSTASKGPSRKELTAAINEECRSRGVRSPLVGFRDSVEIDWLIECLASLHHEHPLIYTAPKAYGPFTAVSLTKLRELGLLDQSLPVEEPRRKTSIQAKRAKEEKAKLGEDLQPKSSSRAN
jgi:hypothetical protein